MAHYETAFKLKVVKRFLAAEGGAKMRTWVSHYQLHGDPAINASADLIVQNAPLTRKLLARITGSRLHGLDQRNSQRHRRPQTRH